MLAVSPKLQPELRLKIEKHAPAFEQLPGVVIIHDLSDGSIAYMSSRGLALLDTTIEDGTSLKAHHRGYLNIEDARSHKPEILGLLERKNDDELISHFQQVRLAGNNDFTWHLSSIKIFHKDRDGKPRLSISLAIPIDATNRMTTKVDRLLQEDNFLHKNHSNFNQLTCREKEILRLTALGKSASEIAGQLFIAETTVETHRRNLKSKLQANTHFHLSQYARAFDLI